MKTVFVSVFPVVQHRHEDGEIVTVKLKRRRGEHSADCEGCSTHFVYRKPKPSTVQHYPSPLLPNVKGNFDPEERSH
ncbi:MAG: hypothetical protein KatS3mg076_2276 [Candidatus Binatia bacterium]|nr:MAG: hypothetical protein KatS3mg076_2276 [Candidatus Binatia bacterium]